ncbi:hypothetical protein [Streptomyces sp. NBC_00069]|uniref:hypothetical protein n=1 Tax=Streptomyces sp. NBC_00069 TaxID=2975639 RepID=UPI00324371E1|nr:hypothetical protein OG513_23060 [Streptomyces sp. NBC_00998]
MVTVREIRAAAQMIGRRNALRYLAIGVGASLVAACGGKDKTPASGGAAASSAAPASASASASAQASGPAGGGAASSAAPTPAVTASSVVTRAFDAFIKGDWHLESTTPNGETVKGTATVNADGGGNSGWTITWTSGPEPITWHGGWLHRGGHLVLDVYEAPKGVSRLTGGQALTVPKEVGENVSLTFPWQPPGHKDTSDGQVLKVTYKNNVLRIVHSEGGHSESVHVCTRA